MAMIFARMMDQKQGEARVVDQRQLLRDRLDEWLKLRPSADELSRLGILGRGPRIAAAREHLDRFLRARAQLRIAEAARIPPGNFEYTDRVFELLAVPSNNDRGGGEEDSLAILEGRLQAVRAERDLALGRLDAADAAWSLASEECRRSVCTGALGGVARGVDHALGLLEAHRASTGSSLADVFADLRKVQQLVARRSCLERIVSVVEKTDIVREAVFAWGGADKLPLDTLEEVPELCAALPAHSRKVGVQRLRFLIDPLHTMLKQEIQQALQATGRWPIPAAGMLAPAAGRTGAHMRAIRSCADLQRVQQVDGELRRRFGLDSPTPEARGALAVSESGDAEMGVWACSAMSIPLIARFRHHFCRPESELCRMDKPEWAFKYLADLSSDHGEQLEQWLREALGSSLGDPIDSGQETRAGGGSLGLAQKAALRCHDLPAGLATTLAGEARLFLRARMPLLARRESHDTLLLTLQHLVRFCSDIRALGGPSAAAVAVADFDANRPIEELGVGGHPDGDVAESEALDVATAGQAEPSTATSGLMAGLSRLRTAGFTTEAEEHHPARSSSRLLAVSAVAAVSGSAAAAVAGVSGSAAAAVAGLSQFADAVTDEAHSTGFLDVWAKADMEFVSGKLTAAFGSGGAAWRPRPLRSGGVGGSKTAAEQPGREEPEAAELATLVADLFSKSRERAECFATNRAREKYALQVLGTGLDHVAVQIRERWNALDDVLQTAQEAALLVETLEEICRFLDRFSLAAHFVAAVDNANTLRLGMLEKLADSFVGAARGMLRRIDTDTCVFSFFLTEPLTVLSRRLRPSCLQAVAQRGVHGLADVLLRHLLWHAPFQSEEQVGLFVANCREDLSAALAPLLGSTDLGPLRSLWDACALLALPEERAADILASLRQVSKCSWTDPSCLDVADPAREAPMSEVLRCRQAEVFAAAGVEELSVADAITVLGKRRELAGSLTDLQDAPIGVLQDLLPTQAQATLQLGADALLQAPLPSAAAAAAAHATLQTGAAAAATLQSSVKELRRSLLSRRFSP